MTDPVRPKDQDEPEATDAEAAADEAAEVEAEAEAEVAAAAETEPVADLEPEDVVEAEAEAEAELEAEAEATAEVDEFEPFDDEPQVAATSAKPVPTSSKAAATVKAPASDETPYVDDRVSKIWVAAIALTFLAIFVYGFLFGTGG